MSKVTIECVLSYTTEIDEEDIETFFSGFHTIVDLPDDIILEDAWLYPTDGEEIHGNNLIKERTN